jgi:ferredoxin-type protein NapG
MERRVFWKILSGTGLAALAAKTGLAATPRTSSRFLRPPGALAEDDFLDRCIRCGKCGESCPNETIKFFDFENGWSSLNTPYITPREKPCILCMKCGDACPTGAISKIPYEANEIMAKVDMGQAQINKNLCLSYQGKSCGVCYRACPLPDVSMTIGYMEQPTVTEACVGCGICERACIQMPQAIRIIPNAERENV